MTAMNAFARPDGAYLIADTGQYQSDGTISGFANKVARSNRLSFMIGHSGMPGPNCQANLEHMLEGCEDQAEVMARIPGLLRDLEADAEDLRQAHYASNKRAIARGYPESDLPAEFPSGIRLFMAWWDQDLGHGRCAAMSSVDNHLSEGIAAFELKRFGTLFTPALEQDKWPGHTFEPMADAKRLAPLQRRAKFTNGAHMVGGDFVLYRASATGIAFEIVKNWPDEVGQPVNLAEPRSSLGGLIDGKRALAGRSHD